MFGAKQQINSMKLKELLIGGAIGGVIAYFILKPKLKANVTGCICKESPCVCKNADYGIHFADLQGDNFSKDPNAPQSQPYVVTYKGFSYPEKELYQVSPFKHFSGVGYKNLLGIDSSIVGGCC